MSNNVAVYVPRPDSTLSVELAEGTGIVGTPLADPAAILIDFEGNLYDAVNIVTFADRVHHAAERHTSNYPTIARRMALVADLIEVGEFNGEMVLVYPDRFADLARWLNPGGKPTDLFDPIELMTAGGGS